MPTFLRECLFLGLRSDNDFASDPFLFPALGNSSAAESGLVQTCKSILISERHMRRLCCMSKWILVALVFYTTVHADIIPVPNTVIPTRVEGAQPRNVVFILSDDHRYDAMSFMGHPFAKTPHMDAMVKEGAHLKNAYVTTSLCSPSRASILTGLYTFRHRVIDNQRPVPDGTLFFPQYLQKAGYKI